MTTVEEMIKEKGADKAPRITPASIEAEIASEYYCNGEQVASVTPADPALRLLTLCILVLKNGFTIVGKSACASPENYNREVGERVAREDAVRQIWPLEGYALRKQLAASGL